MQRYAFTAAVFAICIGAIALHAATRVELNGYLPGGDWALYLHHARNLVDGRPYAETGYVVNPALRSHSPATYPPVYPALLAAAIAAGADPTAVAIAFFGAFLALLARMWRDEMPRAFLIGALAVVAFHPFFRTFTNLLLPEMPFAVFAFGAAALYDRAHRGADAGWVSAICAGLCAGIATATKTAALVLVPAFWIVDLRVHRRPRLLPAIATAAWLVPVAAQALALPGDADYLRMLRFAPEETLRSYWAAFWGIWDSGGARVLKYVLGLATAGLGAAGFLVKARRNLSAADVFVALYSALLMVWAAGYGSRYLAPLIPMLILYAALGASRIPGRLRIPATLALACLVAVNFAIRHSEPPAPIRSEGLSAAASRLRGDPGLVMCLNPRVLSLYAGVRASPYSPAEPIREQAARLGVTHLLANVRSPDDMRVLAPAAAPSQPEWFGDFLLYRIR